MSEPCIVPDCLGERHHRGSCCTAKDMAMLVGKSLRQRIGADDVVSDDHDVKYIDDVSGAPYWLQDVRVDDTGRTLPIVTDYLGRKFEVSVQQVFS